MADCWVNSADGDLISLMESLPYGIQPFIEDFNHDQHIYASSPQQESMFFSSADYLPDDLMNLQSEEIYDYNSVINLAPLSESYYPFVSDVFKTTYGDVLNVSPNNLNSTASYVDVIDIDFDIGNQLQLERADDSINTSLDNLNISLLLDDNQLNFFNGFKDSTPELDNGTQPLPKLPEQGFEAADGYALLDILEREIQASVYPQDELIDICKEDKVPLKLEHEAPKPAESGSSTEALQKNMIQVTQPNNINHAETIVSGSCSNVIANSERITNKKDKSESVSKNKTEINRTKKCSESKEDTNERLKRVIAKLQAKNQSAEKIRKMKEKAKELSQKIEQQRTMKLKNNCQPQINDHLQDHGYSNNIKKNDPEKKSVKIDNRESGFSVNKTKISNSLPKAENLSQKISQTNKTSDKKMHKSEKSFTHLKKHSKKQKQDDSQKDNNGKLALAQNAAPVILCSAINNPQKMASILKISRFNSSSTKATSDGINSLKQIESVSLNNNINLSKSDVNLSNNLPKSHSPTKDLTSKSPMLNEEVLQIPAPSCFVPDMMQEVVIDYNGNPVSELSSASSKVKKKITISDYKMRLPLRNLGENNKPKNLMECDQVVEYDYSMTVDHNYHKSFHRAPKEASENPRQNNDSKLSVLQPLNIHNNDDGNFATRTDAKDASTTQCNDDNFRARKRLRDVVDDSFKNDIQKASLESTLVSQFAAELQKRRKLKDNKKINAFNSKRTFYATSEQIDQDDEEGEIKSGCSSPEIISDTESSSSESSDGCSSGRSRYNSPYRSDESPSHQAGRSSKNRSRYRSRSKSRSRNRSACASGSSRSHSRSTQRSCSRSSNNRFFVLLK
ncbi:hypothetical protein HELRODRAFT_168160 [Helobdella robusta]|uniref:Uncharacterized protein n=1 Tax=Helobdella robusta TaxID=6412 RepID=T1F089_HELRO|nr:hypothetical protein HELRODRAFT_168160 [Helobdella robusta]ESO09201.1 hypothetical protein HELRODRAFT_168160 [Helobdella robusta]